ncbi:MAG TPA: mechanosensitive ion channel family protein [Candidatus Saccharimonadales bacterium]|nr:mechanosensitive ion channel family protein [Candidatus Saccharimonadales bacterium]
MDTVINWTLQNSLDLVVTLIIVIAVYYLGTALLGRVIKSAVQASMKRHDWHYKDIEKRQKTLAELFNNTWRVLIITIGALILFSKLFPGVSLAPLFASAGIIGVALGFGAQSLVKDFISGIFIISENQYRVGDIIEIDGATGTVERIGARSTVIRDADGNVHYFPNGIVQHVINKTMGYSMAHFTVTVHPSHDLDEVIDIINTTGKTLAKEPKWKSKILEPPVFSSVGEFSSSGVTITISGKTLPSDQWSVTSEMRRKLLSKFEEKGIALSGASPAPPSKKKK